MDSYKKFTKDVGMTGAVGIAVALKALVVLPVITKLLGAQNYGVWSQLVITLGFIATYATLGLPFALVRFLPAQKDKTQVQDQVWSTMAIIFGNVALLSLVLLAFSNPLSRFFGGPPVLVQILAYTIIFECLNLALYNVLRAFQKNGLYSSLMIFQVATEIGFVSGSVLAGFGLFGAVLSLLITRLAVFCVMGAYVVAKIGIKMPKFSKIGEHLAFALPTIYSGLAFWIVQSSDRYLIGFFLGTIFVGYYSPTYTIASSITLFVTPLCFVLPAILSKLYDENKADEIRIYLRYSLKYFLMLAIPSAVGISTLAKQLLTIFSTPEIAAHSQNIVVFIAASVVLYGTYMIIAHILVICKKTKIDAAIWMAAAVISLPLNFLLIPRLGILGAAISVLITYIFILSATSYYSFRLIHFRIDWSFILKSFFSSALMAIAIFYLNPAGLLKTLSAVVGGAAFYFAMLFALMSFDEKEIVFIKSFFLKKTAS